MTGFVSYRLEMGPHSGELRPAVIVRHVSESSAHLVVFTLGSADGASWQRAATPVFSARLDKFGKWWSGGIIQS